MEAQQEEQAQELYNRVADLEAQAQELPDCSSRTKMAAYSLGGACYG
ncbi:hypothetical protein Tco_0579760, partial [Tanacetum coccineum]